MRLRTYSIQRNLPAFDLHWTLACSCLEFDFIRVVLAALGFRGKGAGRCGLNWHNVKSTSRSQTVLISTSYCWQYRWSARRSARMNPTMQKLHVKPGHSGCLWRQNRPKLSHFVLRAQGSSAEDKRDAIAERIAKARQYREPIKEETQNNNLNASLPQRQKQQQAKHNTDAPEKLLAFGDSQASKQEQQLFAAVQELQMSPATPNYVQENAAPDQLKPHPDAQQSQPQAASSAKTAAYSNIAQPQPAKSSSKEDMLAKLSQARAYKQEKQAKGGQAPEIVPVGAFKPDSATPQQSLSSGSVSSEPKDAFSATQRRKGPPDSNSNQESKTDGQPQEEHDFLGSAGQAAGYLQQAVKGKDASKGMRQETYSMLKEKEMRNQKVIPLPVPNPVHPDTQLCGHTAAAGSTHTTMLNSV